MRGKLLARFSQLQEIAHKLASQQSVEQLLASLLAGARALTCADGGTIYLLDEDKQLHFSIMQNETLNIKEMGSSQQHLTFTPIPLFDSHGKPNRKNIAALSALDNRTINLPDVYATDEFQLEGVKRFDQKMHYRTTSLLTVPVHNENWGVIGVLQLINCKNRQRDRIEPFSTAEQLLAESLSFQAGTHIMHARMHAESEKLINRITKLNQIGISLSSQESTQELLKEILISAKLLTGADAGTLYLHKDDKLYFEVIQTDSLNIHRSSAEGNLNHIEPINLYDKQGQPNHDLVAAHVAISGSTINIADVYHNDEYNFSGTKAFDKKNGYHSQSFLTVPMHNQKHELIGVLQLINTIHQTTGNIVPFSGEDQELAESLASLAAVALTNKRLNEELKLLLESFIDVISKSIDEKSPYTGGHCRRVPDLAMMIARQACNAKRGPLAEFNLTAEEMYEMKIAAMLHDCGKITTPVHVVDKATKLETIHDRIELLDLRHELIRRDLLIRELQKNMREKPEIVAQRLHSSWSKLADEVAFLHHCNKGGEFMAADKQQRVRAIAAAYSWTDASGKQQPMLSEDEIDNLNIAKGTLSDKEREIINQHVVSTIRMLSSLPFPKHLHNVPEIAGGHHERMDGQGYPNGLTRDQMSIQARILCIADIFEALTATDRPYKSSMPLSRALSILESMKDEGHIDPDLFDLFIDKKLYLSYAEKFLADQQIDIDSYQPKGNPTT